MKYLKTNLFHIFFISIFFQFNLSAQNISANVNTSSVKAENMFTIQGGLFYDNLKYNQGEPSPHEYDLSTFDIKKIGVGLIRFKNKVTRQFLFEFSGYREIYDDLYTETEPGISTAIRGLQFTNLLFELEYFESFIKPEKFENNFHIGYILNNTFSMLDYTPLATNVFYRENSRIYFGAGLKAMYPIKLADRTLLVVSTDLNIFDFGVRQDFTANPNIFPDQQSIVSYNFEFFRPRIGLDFGFVFR